jgi:hypothetical protein
MDILNTPKKKIMSKRRRVFSLENRLLITRVFIHSERKKSAAVQRKAIPANKMEGRK